MALRLSNPGAQVVLKADLTSPHTSSTILKAKSPTTETNPPLPPRNPRPFKTMKEKKKYKNKQPTL